MTRGLRITLVVGTDHHPFDRLIRWADERAHSRPEDLVTVQHGFSRAPETAEGFDVMHPGDLRSLLSDSDVVITHGGPGTIADARAAGHLPLVVPRDPAHGEHVDNHQMLFAAWASGKGLARLVEDSADLDATLSDLGEHGTRADELTGSVTRETTERLVGLLERSDRSALPVSEDAGLMVHVRGPERGAVRGLAEALGAAGGLTSLGASELLWTAGVQQDQRCSCGEPFSGCAFWAAVGDQAFAGWRSADAARVVDLQDRLARGRAWLSLGRRHPGAARRAEALEYSALHRRLYDAAREIDCSAGVVDTSPSSMFPLALAHDRHLDLRVATMRDASPGWAETVTGRALRHRGIPVDAVTDGAQAALRSLGLAVKAPPAAGVAAPVSHSFPAGPPHPAAPRHPQGRAHQ